MYANIFSLFSHWLNMRPNMAAHWSEFTINVVGTYSIKHVYISMAMQLLMIGKI
jgi:hypothetical protein